MKEIPEAITQNESVTQEYESVAFTLKQYCLLKSDRDVFM